jgi:hypothetical protein
MSEPSLDDVFLRQIGHSLRDTGEGTSAPADEKKEVAA